MSFRVLIVLNYVITNLVSGIAHLAHVSESRRGHFDATVWLTPNQLQELVLIQGLGLIAVCVGAMWNLPSTQPPPRSPKILSPFDRSALPVMIVLLLPISLFAFTQILRYASGLNIERVISVSAGMARYSFMSHWLVWIISLSVVWVLCREVTYRGYWPAVILGLGVVAIAVSLQWNGGRSIVLVMALPIILVVLPRLRGTKWIAAPIALAAMLIYFTQISQQRSTRYTSASSDLVEWLDWEWGRFSMLGFALQHSERHGLVFGETIASGISRFSQGILRLIGMAPSGSELRSSMNIAAESLLNSNTDVYVVPGISAELYLNFGVIGVIVGYLLLGLISGWVDTRFLSSATAVTQLAWAYLGTLLVFRTIPVDSASAYNYLFFSGAPILIAAALSFLAHKRNMRTEESAARAGGRRPHANSSIRSSKLSSQLQETRS